MGKLSRGRDLTKASQRAGSRERSGLSVGCLINSQCCLTKKHIPIWSIKRHVKCYNMNCRTWNWGMKGPLTKKTLAGMEDILGCSGPLTRSSAWILCGLPFWTRMWDIQPWDHSDPQESPLINEGTGAMTLSVTCSSFYPSPHNLGMAQRMEILSLPPSLYRCLVLLESPGPRGCDSLCPLTSQFQIL